MLVLLSYVIEDQNILKKSNAIQQYLFVFCQLVTNLSTDKFLQAFNRFIARGGKPRLVLSDKGTNFVDARTKLSDLSRRRIGEVKTSGS